MKKLITLVLVLCMTLQLSCLPVQASDSEEAETQTAETETAERETAETETGEAQTAETETGEAQTAEAESGDSLGITAPSALLMEASTGTVVLEKNAHEQLPPASVTKIMTLLLIVDALSQGKIRLEDTVTTSAYAASMGGSQVFLEEGETQSVESMI